MTPSGIQTVVADTDLAHQVHYRLRYQVFCLDTGFEDPSAHPDWEEKDGFDDRALHFIARTRESHDWVAAARLVLPTQQSKLPVEHICGVDPDNVSRVNGVPYAQTAEFSRLLIHSGPRSRRNGEANRDSRSMSRSARTHARPLILRELIRSMAAYCCDHGIPQWVFLVTPALERILRRMGIELSLIGVPCDHRGIRLPFVAQVAQIFEVLSGPDERSGSTPCGEAYGFFSELCGPSCDSADDPRVRRYGS